MINAQLKAFREHFDRRMDILITAIILLTLGFFFVGIAVGWLAKEKNMNTLSTGEPSTLGTYLRYTEALLGKDSEGAKFFRKKIAESPNGGNEIVIAAESQMMILIGSFAQKEVDNRANPK